MKSGNPLEFQVRRIFASMLLAGLGLLAGCGRSTSSSTTSTTTSTIAGSGSNVMAITVNGGPTGSYPDAAFATATICAPGSTSNCVTVSNLLVDTGSTGLRVFQSEVSSLNLPAVDASNGSAAYSCVNFVDGTYMWGSVQQATVSLGGETASKVPIQVISNSSTGVPSSCSQGGVNDNTQSALGANGILGVGVEPTDCYLQGSDVCDPSGGLSSPPSGAYYTCSGSTCNPAFVTVANQVANPVALFSADNNGVIVELPAVSGSAASVSGSLVFGIGTESNNQLSSSATVFTLACDDFTTMMDGKTLGASNSSDCPLSFIDSGSNGLYFPSTTITQCPSNGNFAGLYCPSATENLTATNEGEDGTSKITNFSVGNAEDLLTSPSTENDSALSTLAGDNPSGYGFDWGLPFFFGVNVYNAIDGQKMPSGAPAAPWWAY